VVPIAGFLFHMEPKSRAPTDHVHGGYIGGSQGLHQAGEWSGRAAVSLAPSALAKNIWRPGKSGNPGGKGGDFKACQALCRSKSSAAAKRMFELAELDAIDENGELPALSSKADPRIVMMAAQWVYERAWGPPKPFDPKDEPDPNKPKFDPRLLSPQQLELVQYALRLMVAASRPPAETVEAEVERWPENKSEA
jgi:hypothetical protein